MGHAVRYLGSVIFTFYGFSEKDSS